MGTVPDPLRSAKLALTTASEEENGLGELKSPKHQQKQASAARNSNGYPCSAKVQPAGEHSLDVNCGTEACMPSGERHCGHDMNQSLMFSPGSSSLSKEEGLVAAEPVKNSRREGSSVSNAKDRARTDSQVLINAAVEEPSTQEDCNIVQSGPGGLLFCKVDDKAILPPGGCGVVMENKSPDNNSSLPPTHQDAQAAAPTVKDTVGGSSVPEITRALPSAKQQGPVSDHGLKAQVHLDTELMDTKNANSRPSVRTVPEPLPKSSFASAPQPLSHRETSEEASPELLKFKDTGTMTVPLESRPADGETVSRTHQDAEVQAVASVESRSASTSPSILAAFLRESMPSEAKQKQEQLHIIYRGASGKEHSEIIDSLAVLGQTAPSTGIMPKVRIQAPAGAEKRLGAQAATVQGDLASRQDATCSSLLDHSEHPCPTASGRTQEMSAKEREVQTADGARGRPGGIAQQLLGTSVLQDAQPVDQISADASDQPAVPSQPANREAKLPPCPALSEISGKHQSHGPCAAENPLASSSCPRVLESAKPPVANAIAENSQQDQPPVKTLGDAETGPTSFHVGVKSKKEEAVVRCPKEQKVNAVGAPAGPQTVGVPVTAQTKQDIPVGGNREVETLASQKKPSGRPESGLSSNSAPGLLAKISALGKESKLALPAVLSSAHPVPSPSKKKKEKPAPDAKVHGKQSKHVRDVVWDEQGMTWEVYGASLDPESLGIAIQNHLQRQIREHEKLIKAQSAQTRKSISSETSSNNKLKGRQHSVFQSMLQNFRRPNCCVRPTASSVLD